jgi:hypothetical protein
VREGEKQTQEEEITRRRTQTNEEKMEGKTSKQTNKPTAERKVVYRNNTQFFKSPESNNEDISGLKFSRKKRSAECKSRERGGEKKCKTPKFSSNSQEKNNNLKHKIGFHTKLISTSSNNKTKQNKTKLGNGQTLNLRIPEKERTANSVKNPNRRTSSGPLAQQTRIITIMMIIIIMLIITNPFSFSFLFFVRQIRKS